jgi:two-component system chemotaxis response regulator CheY
MATRILIVDDSPYMRGFIKQVLTQEEFDVVGEAETSSEALEKYKVLKPDLVTMDIVMKGASGVDALKTIMALDPRAKVLMVSAMGQQGLIIDSIQAGAKGFVIKPIKPEVFVAEIRRLVS